MTSVWIAEPARKRIDALFDTVWIRIDDVLQPEFLRDLVAQFVHRLEFPERIDVQQRATVAVLDRMP